MLLAVCESAPELFHFVKAAYDRPSLLFCGEQTLESADGVQQGDPLGPLLFCLTIHPLIQTPESNFRVFYLDDGIIGGPADNIIHDLEMVQAEASLMSLELNRAKSELVCDDAFACNVVLSAFPGLQRDPLNQATLLGTPLGSVDLIDSTIAVKVEKLNLIGERLQHLSSQDAR